MKPILHVGNIFTEVEGLSPEAEKKLWKALAFKVEGAEFSPIYASHMWDGYRRLYSLKQHHFPTGLASWAAAELSDIEFTIKDHRIKPKPLFKPQHVTDVVLREYQSSAVAAAVKATRGIIRIATGGGKSKVIAELTGRLGMKTLICVHLTPLLYQLHSELQASLPGVKVGLIGDGTFSPRDVTVAMVQSLHAKRKYPQVRNLLKSVGLLCFDEAHHLAADTLYDLAVMAENAYYRFGVSATPWRSDGKDLLIHAATGRRIVDVSASTLIQAGYLAKPQIYLFSVPDVKGIGALSYQSAYRVAIVENPHRNTLIAKLASKLVSQGKTVLIAVNQVNHGKQLLATVLTMVDSTKVAFIRGENESEEKTQALHDLNSGKLKCVIATTVFGEGVDVPNLSALINAKGNLSPVETLQVGGRALRMTSKKTSAIVVDFLDKSKHFWKHSVKRAKTYLEESEFALHVVVDGKPIRVESTKQLRI